jgi:1-acyl-sn-glycerol-3-phosphate acyltransferase
MPDLPPEETLAGMPSLLAHYIVDEPTRVRVRAALEAVETTPKEWSELLAVINSMGDEYGRQPSHPLAGTIARAYLKGLLKDGSELTGAHHLDTSGPTLIVANHLGYCDPLALRELLIRAGRSDLGDRLCAVAGPKVYEDALRMFAVASHPSIRVAQSSQIQDGNSARAMVKITRKCLADCLEMLNEGLLVVLFAEGTRSRDARLQPFIKAVARWVNQPGLTIVPVGHWGSEALYALDGDRLGPAQVFGKVGEPLDVDALRDAGLGRNHILARVHEAVDALLPAAYQCDGDRLR